MTLRERIERGERRHGQEPCSEFRRRTDPQVRFVKDERPEWLQRGIPERDETNR